MPRKGYGSVTLPDDFLAEIDAEADGRPRAVMLRRAWDYFTGQTKRKA